MPADSSEPILALGGESNVIVLETMESLCPDVVSVSAAHPQAFPSLLGTELFRAVGRMRPSLPWLLNSLPGAGGSQADPVTGTIQDPMKARQGLPREFQPGGPKLVFGGSGCFPTCGLSCWPSPQPVDPAPILKLPRPVPDLPSPPTNTHGSHLEHSLGHMRVPYSQGLKLGLELRTQGL